ncbi:MAG: TonB-dependent receptor, partial [Gammaproteobacteria bacterium]
MVSSIKKHASVAAILVAGFTSLTCANLAMAQSDIPTPPKVLDAVEEIVVTAERREEQSQNVPMAITTLSEESLERQQVRSIAQLGEIVPNFSIAPNTGTSSSARIFLRGVGESESFFTADTPVGIYIDDVYIARQTGALFDLFDVERIEVLRGPQGTLYGRNSSAGALKLVTKKPSLGEYAGKVELAAGDYSQIGVRASGNLPIGEKVALQGGFLMRNRDGYTRNQFNGSEVNDQDVKGARLSLLAEPTERFSTLFAFDYIKERSTPGYPVPLALDGTGDPFSNPVPKTGSTFVTNSDIEGPVNDLNQWGLGATLEFNVSDDMTIKSITSYRTMDNLLYMDADGDVYGPAPSPARYHVHQDQDQYQAAQELQLLGSAMGSRLNYVTGVFFFRENNKQDTQSVTGLPALYGQPVASAGRLDLTNIAREELTTDSYAVFGSATFNVTDQLSVTAGLRYTEENKDFSNHVILPNGTVEVDCLNQTVSPATRVASRPCTAPEIALGYSDFTNQSSFDKSWNDWTPRFVVDYQFTDSVMMYASAAKGFKGGTTSGRDTNPLRNLNRLIGDPETNWSYELGVKADWLERRLRTNLAVFHNEYKGLQAGLVTPDGAFGRINSGNITFEGAELEVTAVPIEGLELTGSVGLLDSKYTKWSASLSTCAPQGITTNDQYLNLPIKQAPDWQYRLGANYSYDLGKRGVVSVGADYTAKDDYYNNVCGTEGISTKDYEFLSAQLRWEDATGKVLVTLSGTNLTDSE